MSDKPVVLTMSSVITTSHPISIPDFPSDFETSCTVQRDVFDPTGSRSWSYTSHNP